MRRQFQVQRESVSCSWFSYSKLGTVRASEDSPKSGTGQGAAAGIRVRVLRGLRRPLTLAVHIIDGDSVARIAIGGFQHETNTFAPSKADYPQFEAGGGWPGVKYGEPIFGALEGTNIPAQGAVQALRAAGHSVVGTAWAAASPSAHVTREAFERILGEMVARLKALAPVDGVYLDLHGAMVSEDYDDGEGEILRRVREVIGARVPLVASLDLHGNVTRAMVERADAMVGYRTYPHVDMADTGARAARLLDTMLKTGTRPAKSYATLDFLTGLP
ncbi:MAG: M81 family metallopeptidase, partial [Betaproteobacteria bacterium]|nr:M81 family metallopeptidase [Betaproteobacteria bacterium]